MTNEMQYAVLSKNDITIFESDDEQECVEFAKTAAVPYVFKCDAE